MSQIYIALGFLISCAVSVVAIASHRCRKTLMRGESEIALQTDEALSMPLNGSVVLFSAYVLLRFIPKEYFNALISFYLSVLSIFALGAFLKGYVRPSVLTGLLCVGTATVSYVTGNWIANDILAFAIGVTALESLPVGGFLPSFVLLIGLFFYDIFWVFGSDVMLTVATGIDGPIKILFPQTIFGDHKQKSLLGLGDVIVPGFFICQTLVFSRDYVKRGSLYFTTAMIAYTLSLINTMVVMIVFQHGQPALLFIVPWLLISFCAIAIYHGDVHAAWSFDILTVFSTSNEERPDGGEASHEEDASLGKYLWECVLHLFGIGLEEEEKQESEAATLRAKKEA
jgi:minor histocompatibility antigen H13